MSGNDKNINHYSASDIQKYLRGELSAPEMHQLERAALDDPFLADALEGMEIHRALPSSPIFQEDLDELQEKLDNRVAQKDRRGLLFHPAWKIAAAIILLLGLGITAYFSLLNKAKQDSPVAMLERKIPSAPPPAPSVTADSIAITSNTQTMPPPVAPPASSINKSRQETAKTEERAGGNAAHPLKAAKAEKAGAPEEQVAPVPGSPHDREVLAAVRINPAFKKQAKSLYQSDSLQLRRDTATLSDSYVALDKLAAAPATLGKVLENKQAGLKTSTFSASSDQLVFTGKVTDLNNNALSGASLRLKGNYPASTVTDKYGNFSLKLPKKDTSFTLTVAYVGYEQASLALNFENRTGNLIQLQPQTGSLNEVVVIGYGTKRKEILQDNSEPKKEFRTQRAIPADGWPAYNSYLDAGKKIKNPDSTLKGNETISFIVNKEGGLSSFKVEQSLSPAHDSVSILLIHQGPSWKLLKGKKTRAFVTIPF
jgi:hypothetical protein